VIRKLLPLWIAVATCLIGSSLAIGAAFWQARNNHELARERFNARTYELASQVVMRVQSYEDGLRGVRGAILAVGPEQMTRERFANYNATRDNATEFRGAHGFGFVRRVAVADTEQYIATMRQNDWPEFAIRELSPHEGDRYVIQLVEPLDINRAAIGLDIASEPHRRAAAEASMRSARATITAPISLVQSAEPLNAGFLVLLPIYRAGMPLDRIEDRIRATVGWSYGPLLINEVLQGLPATSDQITFTLRDRSAADAPLIYQSPNGDRAATADLEMQITETIFGRRWTISTRATPQFLSELHQPDPFFTGSAGCAIAVLLALLAYFLAVGPRGARALQQEQKRRAAIVASSTDAIIGELLDGTIVEWNPAAERLFGRSFNEARGRSAAELLLPPDRAHEDTAICTAIARGESIAPFDTTRQRSDGVLIDVSVAAAPIYGDDGRCVGFAKTIRDISFARRAQQQLAALNADLERQVAARTNELDAARHTLQTILDAVPSQIGYWDNQLRNRVANRAYKDWFGIAPEKLHGMHIREVLGEKIYAANQPHLEAALRGEPQSFAGMPVSRPDGNGPRHTSVNYLPDIVEGEVRGIYTFVYDVSDLVAEKTKLAAAEHDLRTILDAVPSTIGYWDRNLINRVANQAYKEWFGVDTIHGTPLRTLLGEDLFAKNRQHIEAALRGEPQTFERVMPKFDGSGERYALTHYLPDVVAGEVRGFYALTHDVTELVQSRHDLASVRRDNRALLNSIRQHTIVTVADRSGRIIDVNEGFCSISGYTRDELIGQSHSIINSGTHDREFWTNVWRRIASGQSWRGEVCNRAKDGSHYWVDSIISPFFGDDGKIERYVSIRTDISDRKRAQAELLTTSSLLQSVLDAASELSIIATTVDGTINVFNHGAQRMLGYTETEMVGKSTPTLIHLREELDARGRELSRKHEQLIAGFQVLVYHAQHFGAETREWTYVRKNGMHVPVSMTVTAVRNAAGQPAGYLGIAMDISEQRNQEKSLRAAMAKAEEANIAKGRFLANMSHEIRTPMNAVMGLTHILESTALTAHQVGLVGKIKLAGKSLLAIINDLLDLSKIEAAEMKLENVPFNLGGLLQDMAALVTVQIEAKGIAFQIDTPPDLPAVLVGDPMRLHQILLNLLTNAVKFTHKGGVRLLVQEVASLEDKLRLRFIVQDSGIGIAQESLQQLFKPFVQADTSTTRRFGGTGLGLSIVRQLVTLMKGELNVTSTPNVGSEFRVEIDLTRGDELGTAIIRRPDIPEPQGQPLTGVRVLVVDDSTINLEVAKCVLESQGASVELASNGQEAVDFLVAKPQAVDIVLMDVHMPVLDGHDAARRIRSGLGLTQLPIIALTAGTMASERSEAETSGMNDFISKPFGIDVLVSGILRHVTVPQRAVPVPAPSSQKPKPTGLAWPSISGIDIADVRARLAGDLPLFRSMVRRMLNDFANLDHASMADEKALRDLTARLHELKGSSGTLGAKAIHALAAEAETSCRARDLARSARLLQELATELRQLEAAAATYLESLEEDTTATAVFAIPPIQTQDLEALIRLLQQYDLEAVTRVGELSAALKQHLGKTTYASLRQRIDDLRFSDAADLLKESMQVRAKAG
jgi:PAS domain S-box-containing protein